MYTKGATGLSFYETVKCHLQISTVWLVCFNFLTILSKLQLSYKLQLTRKRSSCGTKLGYFFPLTNKDTVLMHFDFLYKFYLHLKFIFHILKFVNVIFLYLRVDLCAEYEALNPGKLILLSVLKMTNISLDDDRTPKGAGSLSPEYTPREGEVSFCPSNNWTLSVLIPFWSVNSGNLNTT